MSTSCQDARAEGVGVAYHPFLHDAVMARLAAFDFIELPLDLYVDPARAAMLDPGDERLQEIAAAKPCVWRGTALSIGSVEAGHASDYAPGLIRRVRRRLEQVGSTRYTEAIGFRRLAGQDIGSPQALPMTEAAAQWFAVRQRAASEALGVEVLLQPISSVIAPHAALDEAAFLGRIAALSGCGLVLDAADLSRLASSLPAHCIRALTLTGADAAEWQVVSALAGSAGVNTIVLRRDRALFPLDTIGTDAARAADILAATPPRATAPPPNHPPELPDASALAELHAYQSGLMRHLADADAGALGDVPGAARPAWATDLASWKNWRGQIDDLHKTKQIAAFLSRSAGPRPPGSGQ